MKVDLYYLSSRLDRLVARIAASEEVPGASKEVIMRFRDHCFALGLSTARVLRYLQSLRDLAVWLGKPFQDASREDLKVLVASVERSPRYAEATKYEYKRTVKRFYRWLRDCEDPEEVAWLKLRQKRGEKKLPEELLSEADVRQLLEGVRSPRDRALAAGLYESGCRVGEFLSLRIKDIEFDRHGARLHVSGKTGARVIRIVQSVQALTEWLNRHPARGSADAFVWVLEGKNRLINYATLTKILRVAGQRAGLPSSKRLNPHNFRHSRATHLANYLTEQQLKVYFGWEQSSKMAAIYVHLSGQDMDKAILGKVYGLENAEAQQRPMLTEAIPCPRCKENNSPSNQFCYRCGEPLGQDEQRKATVAALTRKTADALMDELVKDPEVVSLLLRKIKEHGLGELAESL